MNNLSPDPTRLGDDLERAVAARMGDAVLVRRRRKLRSRTTIAAFAAAGIVAIGAGAAAVSLLSTDSVESGMPGGNMIFTGTGPKCATTDHMTFTCTLKHAPTAPVQDSYKGTKETFDDPQGNVAGGCIGQGRYRPALA